MPTTEDLLNELDDWRRQMLLTPTCIPKPIIANAIIALRGAPEWQGVLAYDEFALATMALQPPPWLHGSNTSWAPARWTDREDVLATSWLQHRGISVTVQVTAQAVEAVAKDASYHPIRDYLGGLEWDKTKRLDTFTSIYLGSDDTSYHTAVGHCMLIAAVARVMQPGCKADHVLILEGEQGTLKSSAIDALFTPWFSDDVAELGSKDAAMQVRCAWGIEIAELASMSKGETERIKAFVSRRTDRFRPAYGRRVIEAHRQSIFIGTTNAETYLKDETGGRRYWPVSCRRIDLDAIKRDRNQLWAEAVTQYNAGAEWWLTNEFDIEAAAEHQEDRRTPEAWETVIAEYIAKRTSVSIDEILEHALFLEKARWTQPAKNSIARSLVSLKWGRYRETAAPRTWRYRPRGG